MDMPRENVCCQDTRCITTFDNFHLFCLSHPVETVAVQILWTIHQQVIAKQLIVSSFRSSTVIWAGGTDM